MKALVIFPNSPIVSDPCCEGHNPAKVMPYEMINSTGNLVADFDTQIIDAKAEGLQFHELVQKMRGFDAEMVAMWATPYSLLNDLKVLKEAKKQGSLTVLAMNPPILLEQILERFPFVDACLRDEKPFTLKEIAKKHEAGKSLHGIKGIACRKNGKAVETRLEKDLDYSALPFPAFDLAPMQHYNKATGLIISSRGCPFQCTFCFWGRSRWRSKTPEQTTNEVEALVKNYGFKNIGFLDQHFTINKDYVYGFLKEIERRKLDFNWFCESRVENAEQGFFEDMHAKGLKRVIFGVEHVNEQILANMKKHQTKEGVEKAIRIAKKTKVRESTPLILGLPGETWETVKELRQFIIKTKPWNYGVFPPIPLPGTPLYEQAKKNNWLLVEEKPENFWARSDFSRPLMAVPPMTPKDLEKARKQIQLLPRLHPGIFLNTVRDLYMKGGISKVGQIFGAAANVMLSREETK